MPDLRPDSPNNHGMQERTTLGGKLAPPAELPPPPVGEGRGGVTGGTHDAIAAKLQGGDLPHR